MEDDGPPGVPEWVVTYGDMMSLLLTFFIMLVSLSELKQQELYRAVMEALQQRLGYPTGQISPPGDQFPLNSLVEQLTPPLLGSTLNDTDASGGIKSQSTPGENLRIVRKRDGQDLVTGQPLVFSAGQAAWQEKPAAILTEIVEQLTGKPNKIEIRGFAGLSDGQQLLSYQDRIDLAYKRSELVRQQLEKLGVEPSRCRFRLDLVELNANPEENRLTGITPDRVEVVILDEFAKGYVGSRDN